MKIMNSLCTFSHRALQLQWAWWHLDSICVSLWVTHVKERIFSFHLAESLITVQWIMLFPGIDIFSLTHSRAHSVAEGVRNQVNCVSLMFRMWCLSCSICVYYQAACFHVFFFFFFGGGGGLFGSHHASKLAYRDALDETIRIMRQF